MVNTVLQEVFANTSFVSLVIKLISISTEHPFKFMFKSYRVTLDWSIRLAESLKIHVSKRI